MVHLPDERPCRRHRSALGGRAAARRPPPSGELAGCLASLANFTMYAGHYREAVPIAERAISVSDAVGARGRRVEAMGALGASVALAGDCGRGLAVLRDALATAKALEEPVPIGMAYLGLASTLYDCDDLEEAVVSASPGRRGLGGCGSPDSARWPLSRSCRSAGGAKRRQSSRMSSPGARKGPAGPGTDCSQASSRSGLAGWTRPRSSSASGATLPRWSPTRHSPATSPAG